jgi:hypothetical protein
MRKQCPDRSPDSPSAGRDPAEKRHTAEYTHDLSLFHHFGYDFRVAAHPSGTARKRHPIGNNTTRWLQKQYAKNPNFMQEIDRPR